MTHVAEIKNMRLARRVVFGVARSGGVGGEAGPRIFVIGDPLKFIADYRFVRRLERPVVRDAYVAVPISPDVSVTLTRERTHSDKRDARADVFGNTDVVHATIPYTGRLAPSPREIHLCAPPHTPFGPPRICASPDTVAALAKGGVLAQALDVRDQVYIGTADELFQGLKEFLALDRSAWSPGSSTAWLHTGSPDSRLPLTIAYDGGRRDFRLSLTMAGSGASHAVY